MSLTSAWSPFPQLGNQVFTSNETKVKFHHLSKWLALRNAMRIAIVFADIDDHYSYIDPDGGLENKGALRMSM